MVSLHTLKKNVCMKIVKLVVSMLAALGCAQAATVNIQISQGANQATNFASKDGTTSNGLVWGIIVSTTNNTFSQLPQNFQLGTSLNGILIPGTDDYFIASTNLTAQGTQGDLANPGKITSLNSVAINVAENAITTGNQFAIVWFDTSVTSPTGSLTGGQWYGLMTNAAWTIPAASGTQNISAFFSATPDPVKNADDIQIAPEPSAMLLGLLGALGLLRRRR